LVEQPIRNRQVIGSSPIVGSNFAPHPKLFAVAAGGFSIVTATHTTRQCDLLNISVRILSRRAHRDNAEAAKFSLLPQTAVSLRSLSVKSFGSLRVSCLFLQAEICKVKKELQILRL
jgi:hypothetical protein